jgi:hypothetical protein
MKSLIGSYVKRPKTRTWHLVESEVADSVVVRCGRRMDIVLSGVQLTYVEEVPLSEVDMTCYFCSKAKRRK